MVKRFTYIVLFITFLPALSFALVKKDGRILGSQKEKLSMFNVILPDTTKNKRQDDKKIKEIGKAKRQPKPQKLDEPATDATDQKVKPKRQRRPEGLERPPEIPRRSGGG
jgi:hypothetical protein